MNSTSRIQRSGALVGLMIGSLSLAACSIPTRLELDETEGPTGDQRTLRLIKPYPPVAVDRVIAFSERGDVLWDCIAEDCRARPQLQWIWGRVPRGFRQLTPRVGTPAPLGKQEPVTIVISDRFQEGNCAVGVLTRQGDRLCVDDYSLIGDQSGLDNRIRMLLGDW